jgi:hypothetical protein
MLCLILGLVANNEEKLSKEAVVAHLKVFKNVLEGTEKNHAKPLRAFGL